MHFVHDQGIIPSDSPMQKALYRALDKALESKTYMPDEGLPMCSFTQEYLIMGIEAYFGLWQHDPGGNGYASGGEYKYINRKDFKISTTEAQHPDFQVFYRTMLFCSYAARTCPDIERHVIPDRPMSGSIPKVIDNAIIAYVAPYLV